MKATITVPDGVFGGTVVATVENAEVPPNGNEGAGIWVSARCYQGGELVYGQMAKVVDGQAELTLGPTQIWQGENPGESGGAAHGEAAVGYWTDNFSRFRELADTTFEVSA